MFIKNMYKVKMKKFIVSTLLASILLNTISYADINNTQMSSVISKINEIDDTVINTRNLDVEEIALSHVLRDNNWIAFYKNFIRELGGVKLSYYDKNGNLIDKKYVLPKQFEGSSYEYERETVYAEDTLILRDTVNKYSIDLSGFDFSDSIPCFINKAYAEDNSTFNSDIDGNEDDIKDAYVRINFNKWDNCKNISEWLEDRTNIQNLTNELGLSFEGADDLNAWLGEYDAEYKSPGILIEPITFYPDSTEEIYCNDKNICRDYNLTHGLTSNRLEVEMKEYGNWNWWSAIVHKVSTFFNFDSMDIYIHIHIGILKYDVNDTIIREDGDKAVSEAEREYRHEYDADAGFVEYNGWSDDKSN